MINTDDDLLELLLIPKVGRAKAKILYSAGYKSCQDLASADPEELAKLPGIGPELARSIVDYAFHTATLVAPDKLETGSELLICPNCGSMVSGSTNVCSGCGITFSDEVEELEEAPRAEAPKGDADGHWYKEQGKLFICPNCGSLVSDKSESCPKCGILFAGEEEEEEAQPAEAPKGDADGFWYKKDDSGLFMCPNCGAFIAKDATGCSICGMAFEAGGDEGEEEEPPAAGPKTCPMCKAALPDGEDMCKACGYDLSLDKEIDGHWYKDRTEIFLCPGCGAFLTKSADSCPHCGIVLEGEEEAPEPQPAEAKCPMCGASLPAGKKTCDGCGFDFTAGQGDGFWYKEEKTALFICPSCGAFISETAERCTNCGVTFNEEGEAVQAPAQEKGADAGVDDLMGLVLTEGAPAEEAAPVPGAEDAADQLAVCPVCGAFIGANLLKCPVCGAVFDDIGEMELEPVEVPPGESKEELNRQISEDIREIEEMLVIRPEAKTDKRGGVSKDFLDRWKKLDSGKPQAAPRAAPPEDEDAALEQELEKMLVAEAAPRPADPVAEAADLAAAGDIDGAVEVLEGAAEADPSRATEFRRLMLELMGRAQESKGADISGILAEDDLGELVLDQSLSAEADLQRLGELEAALASDPDDAALWQEKGDVLERLGRHLEAVECFDRSIAISYADLRKDAKGALPGRGARQGAGLTNGRVNGLTNGKVNGLGRTNGRVNGLVNGRVNGRTNGRGRVNGLVNGRTNGRGRVNGLVNGLTNGRTNGRTNGFSDGRTNGLINGGLVNGLGLVNGEGMVDGSGSLLRLRHRRRERIMWRYKLTAMVMFVTLVLMLSMLGNLAVRQEGGAMSIDGGFSDWEDVRGYSNLISEDVAPSLRILETRMAVEDARLYVYVLFGDQGFDGAGAPGNVDSLWMAVDVDPGADTGYIMGDMGVDLMGEVYGWNGSVMGSGLLRFGSADRDDWAGFVGAGQLQTALEGDRLEALISMPRDVASRAADPRVRAITIDSEGNSDFTRYLMGAESSGMTASFAHSAADVLQPGAEGAGFGTVTLTSHSDGGAGFTSLDFEIAGDGTQSDVQNPTLAHNGVPAQAQASFPADGIVRFTFQQPLVPGLGSAIALSLAADIPTSAEGKALGLRLVNATATSGSPSVANTGTRLHNIGSPGSMAVDGAFGDWAAVPAFGDAAGDVVSANPNSTFINANVDLGSARLAAPADGSGSLYFCLSVEGTMMGGSSIPTVRHRPSTAPVGYGDSDKDTVPDNLDPFNQDFDNDGTPDAQSITGGNLEDADGDGSADYPAGPDRWLNTTLPSDFPEPYAGRFVSIYIGPIDASQLENHGEDSAFILIDTDSDPGTGAALKGGVGVDSLVAITGKGNRVLSAGLYSRDGASETGWSFVENVTAAVDWDRMEGALPLAYVLSGGQRNMTVFVQLEDWKGARDGLDAPAGFEVSEDAVPDTRAAKPSLDIAKTVNLATAAPGSLLVYTITIANQRGATAYNVRVTEAYPAGVTFVSATPAPSTGNNVWNLGTMPVGSTRTITVTVQIASTGFVGGEVLTNTATVYFTDGGAWFKTRSATASTTIVVPVPEIGLVVLPVGGIMVIGIIAIGRRRADDE